MQSAAMGSAGAAPGDVAAPGGPEGTGASGGGAGRLAALPRGLLVFPFIVAAGLTLVVAVALGEAIDGIWVLAAIGAGLIAAAASLLWGLRRPGLLEAAAALPPASADPARGPTREESGEPDPLANVHAVEAQGRRHRKPCPNCGTPVGTDREKCPSCGHLLLLDCKGCRTRVRLEWGVCPECGRGLP